MLQKNETGVITCKHELVVKERRVGNLAPRTRNKIVNKSW